MMKGTSALVRGRVVCSARAIRSIQPRFGIAFDQCGAVVGFVRFWTGVDWEARAVWSGVGSNVSLVNIVCFDEVCCEACLAEVDRYFTARGRPLEVGTEKPVYCAHELDGNEAGEELFEVSFKVGISGEIDEVVNVNDDERV